MALNINILQEVNSDELYQYLKDHLSGKRVRSSNDYLAVAREFQSRVEWVEEEDYLSRAHIDILGETYEAALTPQGCYTYLYSKHSVQKVASFLNQIIDAH